MELSNLRPAEGSKQSDNFRRGRGHGSGNGKTAGKGHKGQIAVNVDILNRFEDGTEVTPAALLASGAISKLGDGVKLLGNGELTKKLNVKVNAVSESAKAKIEAAGGTVEVI